MVPKSGVLLVHLFDQIVLELQNLLVPLFRRGRLLPSKTYVPVARVGRTIFMSELAIRIFVGVLVRAVESFFQLLYLLLIPL